MHHLLDRGYSVLSLSQAWEALTANEELPEKAIVVTFDDGYEDNYTTAFPLLSELSIPATIFLATGYLGKNNQWMSGNEYPERPMMTWDNAREMAGHGIDFGAHTVTHPRLSELSNETAFSEIRDSKKHIEDELGVSCDLFAYPYGNFGTQTPQLVENAGFSLACSTRSGFNNPDRNPFLLHRIEVYGDDSTWKLNQKITFGHNDASFLFPLKYYARRLLSRI